MALNKKNIVKSIISKALQNTCLIRRTFFVSLFQIAVPCYCIAQENPWTPQQKENPWAQTKTIEEKESNTSTQEQKTTNETIIIDRWNQKKYAVQKTNGKLKIRTIK
jgi:hypothetical protein